MRTLKVLGIRGVPAAHGGFETFAERLAEHLVAAGWRVIVYCQHSGSRSTYIDSWRGVERVNVSTRFRGALGTVVFDLKSVSHAARTQGLCLTLGYNTACFSLLFKVLGIKNVINMDGIEWARTKWGRVAKLWFWLNERAGCWLGDHLVADHPEIKTHLATRVDQRKITMIAYGGDSVELAPVDEISRLGLTPQGYLTLIARPEPENSVLEVVSGFSSQKRGFKLVVLGAYDRDRPYHRDVLAAASEEVVFAGPIYGKETVRALRYHCLGYVHGHQVGGTNPSLVEALGARNPVLAHDNRFNRWVAGDAALYFSDRDGFEAALSRFLESGSLRRGMAVAADAAFRAKFSWPYILDQYEKLLEKFIALDSSTALKEW